MKGFLKRVGLILKGKTEGDSIRPSEDHPAGPMSDSIESHLDENRVFPPSSEFQGKAHLRSMEDYRRLHAESISDPDVFWARQAEELHWQKRWDRVLQWDPPFAQWFVGGQINVSENCLDRHAATQGDKVAILFEGEPG
ncbi:MAG: acetyl-coenzyme A synthetase N-terminal domain-containing protein, partial [Verrucomicrobiota bacterium]